MIPPNTHLIGIERKDATSLWNSKDSLIELAELAKTAGLKVLGKTSQTRAAQDPKYYIGKGKLEEVKNHIIKNNIEIIIADDELSTSQLRNLEQELNIKILDRTSLVLDIFAKRAHTHEAKLQVELAQLEYLLPRLTRMWLHLSRLGGGIGTRGPGETQLEVDKRRIKTRMSNLKKGLKKVRQHRTTMRRKRESIPILTAALVGYTNSGKSTLMNKLTKTSVLVENKLFATLDPTTRKIILPNKDEVMISDTVGFIQKLPHQLVDAFMATLEEVIQADILLHMVDIAHPKYKEMIKTSRDLLKELALLDKPRILIFNKCDKISQEECEKRANKYENYVFLSALKNNNFDGLFSEIEKLLADFKQIMTFRIPYKRMDIVNLLHQKGEILSENYKKDIEIKVNINSIIGNKIMGQLYH